jgi:NitT/TauT family transport system permease protein
LKSVQSRRDTGVSRDAGKVSRLRRVRFPATLRYTMLLAAFLGLWQIYVTFVGQISLPGPLEVVGTLSEDWSGGRLAAATGTTLGTLALGMLIGAMIASLLTVFAAWTRIGADLLTLLTLTLYPVPAIALLPLLILWFDTSLASLVVVSVCSVTLPTAINLSAGLRSVNPTIVLVGQNLGLRGWRMFSAVLLPAALPHAISGLRAGWASSWRTVIAAGLVFGVAGGRPTFFTNDAGDFLPPPELLAGLLTIAFAGILVEATFHLLERGTVVRWGMKVGSSNQKADRYLLSTR